MLYKLGLFTVIIAIFTGCSKTPDANYNWQSTNTIIHNKVLELNDKKIKEIKYFTISKKEWRDGTTTYTDKEDQYLYLKSKQKVDMTDKSLQDTSKKYDLVVIFKGDVVCKKEDYPCSFERLRLNGEVYQNGKRSRTFTRKLSLIQPITIKSEKEMQDKVKNFFSSL